MPGNQARERAELATLASQLEYHEAAYRRGEPEIPDGAFDALLSRYEELADALGVKPEARLGATPGADHAEGFETVAHRVPMLSLEKLSPARKDDAGRSVSPREQLEAWIVRRRKELELGEGTPLDLFVEPKIDGISVSLAYRDGELVRAVTRGDGAAGDVITAQVRAARAVPTRLAGEVPGELELRGELYLPRAAFAAQNEALAARGEKLLANPRNACAGMMKRKDPTGLEGLGVRSFLYQVITPDGALVHPRQRDVLEWLARAGCATVLEFATVASSAQDAIEYCERFDARRTELPFEIDGMVIKIDDLRLARGLGATGHHPHWGVAYKFPPERRPTKLLGVLVQVGKSGKLTPVAELEPVLVSGTTVQRASLHNYPELERKDVRIGDTVLVEKAGEIIPQVVEVVHEDRREGAQPIARPTACPACGAAVHAEEIFLYCSNPACPAQVRERLQHFASRGAMDIDGLGESIVDALVGELGLSTPDGLYTLEVEALAGLPRLGQKSAKNLVSAIDASRARGLSRLLVALAIRHLGESMAEALATHFGSMERLLDFAERYVAGDADAVRAVAPEKSSERGIVEGLGRKSADVIFASLVAPEMRRVIEALARAGVSTTATQTVARAVEGVAGKSFVLTGTLPNLGRADAAARIKSAGGKVSGSVSKKTSYVVVGSDAGSKLEEAVALGVPQLDEAGLLTLLGEG